MPSFGNTVAGLKTLRSEIQGAVSDLDRLVEGQTKARDAVDQSKKTFDVFASLLERSKAEQNDWSKEFELTLELIRVGGDGLDKFRSQFGDAVIQTQDGARTIKELLSGMDLDTPRQEIQQLIQDLDQGGADLDRVLAFLQERAGTLAKGLIEVIRRFKEGKASLEEVQYTLDQAREAFGGSEFGGLADALADGFQGGTLT